MHLPFSVFCQQPLRPPQLLQQQYFTPSTYTTVYGWKGTASYYTLQVNGAENANAAWYYPSPKSGAAQIKDYIAFGKGVMVLA